MKRRITAIFLATAMLAGTATLLTAGAVQAWAAETAVDTTLTPPPAATSPAPGTIQPPAAPLATAIPQLATVSGVVLCTMVIVQVVKKAGASVMIVERTPVWVIAVVVACGLTALASAVLGTLPGELIGLLWQAALAAGSASGFFTWLKEPSDSPGNSTVHGGSGSPPKSWVSFLAIPAAVAALTCASGCSTALSKGQQYKVASSTYTGTLNAITALSKAGAIPLADLARIDAVRGRANELLNKMRAAVAAGTTLDWTWYSTQLNTLLEELIQLEIQAEQRKTKPKETSYDGTRSSGPLAGRPGTGDGDRRRDLRGDRRGQGTDGRRAGLDRRGPGQCQRQLCRRTGTKTGGRDADGNGRVTAARASPCVAASQSREGAENAEAEREIARWVWGGMGSPAISAVARASPYDVDEEVETALRAAHARLGVDETARNVAALARE